MTSQERLARIDAKIKEEHGLPLRLFWLSFCDTDLPAGSQFLGACIVEAEGPATAMDLAWRHGCNPGGEITTWELPESSRQMLTPYLYRLLSKREILLFDQPSKPS